MGGSGTVLVDIATRHCLDECVFDIELEILLGAEDSKGQECRALSDARAPSACFFALGEALLIRI